MVPMHRAPRVRPTGASVGSPRATTFGERSGTPTSGGRAAAVSRKAVRIRHGAWTGHARPDVAGRPQVPTQGDVDAAEDHPVDNLISRAERRPWPDPSGRRFVRAPRHLPRERPRDSLVPRVDPQASNTTTASERNDVSSNDEDVVLERIRQGLIYS